LAITSRRRSSCRQKVLDLYKQGSLSDPQYVAGQIWTLTALDLDNGSVIDLRKLDLAQSEEPV